MAHYNTTGVLGRLFWHSIILQEHWRGCAGTTEYYRILRRLFWHTIILQEHWRGCAGIVKYYGSTGKAVLVQ